ncbi:MAG: hypothetical protein ACXW3C_07355 [Pyrinomonadaceae bacterium]
MCLGEDHGSKNDSDLRIALVEHPDFVRKVRVIMVESASVTRQDVLDRFILEGEEMPREKLRVVWAEASGAEVWESPIYEAFLRAVRKAEEQRAENCGKKRATRNPYSHLPDLRDSLDEPNTKMQRKGFTVSGTDFSL